MKKVKCLGMVWGQKLKCQGEFLTYNEKQSPFLKHKKLKHMMVKEFSKSDR